MGLSPPFGLDLRTKFDILFKYFIAGADPLRHEAAGQRQAPTLRHQEDSPGGVLRFKRQVRARCRPASRTRLQSISVMHWAIWRPSSIAPVAESLGAVVGPLPTSSALLERQAAKPNYLILPTCISFLSILLQRCMRRTLQCSDSSLSGDTFLLVLIPGAGCSLSAVIVREIFGPAAYLCLDGQILGMSGTPVGAVFLVWFSFQFDRIS